MVDFKKMCRKSEKILKDYVRNKLHVNKDSEDSEEDLKDIEVFDTFKVDLANLKSDETYTENNELIDSNDNTEYCDERNDDNACEDDVSENDGTNKLFSLICFSINSVFCM